MSNFNYMENVPVKIAEKYKPPPKIYQLPTTIVNKLQLPERYYEESPQFSYDFQLERKVLLKIPEYRRMRQAAREARQSRIEKRELEKQRQIEAEHKLKLGAISYPNAAELSSSSGSENEQEDDEVGQTTTKLKQKETEVLTKQKTEQNWQHQHNFHSILQPTVLSNDSAVAAKNDIALAAFEKAIASHKEKQQAVAAAANFTSSSSGTSSLTGKKITFNYKDFEEDTSSPFDNIELKTINDLDILAQVLHETQLKANDHQVKDCGIENGEITNDKNEDEVVKVQQSSTNEITVPNQKLPSTSVSPTTTFDLNKVNFGDISLELMAATEQQLQTPPTITANNIPIQQQYMQNACLPSTHTILPHNYQVYYNQNFHFSTPNGNVLQQQHQQYPLHSVGNNNSLNNFSLANKEQNQQQQPKSPQVLLAQQQLEQELNSSKSKSVPDIIRELRDELKNSEMRRTRLRNHSFNQSDERGAETQLSPPSAPNAAAADIPKIKLQTSADDSYAKLEFPLQSLAKNISSMGFPLERVAKVTKIYGDNDKKIVEHLIPLTELLDLGFEETRISEALIQFDNNKEKALEHLIS